MPLERVLPQSCITFGLEIETTSLDQNRFPISLRDTWTATHDASIESPETFLRDLNLPFTADKRAEEILNRSTEIMNGKSGAEFVSRILDGDDISTMRKIEDLCRYCNENGEVPSNRAGLHYHISFPSPSLSSLKNLVRIWAHLEDMIYTLAGMGGTYRGWTNNSAYARPLTGEGIYVPVRNRESWGKAVEIPRLLEATSPMDFFTRFGDCSYWTQASRYFPVRYYGLNLASILKIGTVEFRPCNVSLNPEHIKVGFKFFQFLLMVSTARGKGKELCLEENSIYSPKSKENMLSRFGNLLERFPEFSDFSDRDLGFLEGLIHTSEIPDLEPAPVKSHLYRRSDLQFHWRDGEYLPDSMINPDRLEFPSVVDYYALNGNGG